MFAQQENSLKSVCSTTVPPSLNGKITTSIEKLLQSIERLESITNILIGKLQIVCKPNQICRPTEAENRVEANSQMADGIEAFANRVNACQETLNTTFNLLDF